jgi:hypothetical protein
MIGFSMSFPLPYIQIEELRTNGTAAATLNVKSLEVTSNWSNLGDLCRIIHDLDIGRE